MKHLRHSVWTVRWHCALVAAFCLLLGATACSPRKAGDDSASKLPEPPAATVPLAPLLKEVTKAVVMSELSPAILLHTDSKTVSFFVPEGEPRSAAPRFAVFGANGPKIVTNGVAVDVAKMQERWLMAWFTGASGWEKADCPVGIFLQYPLRKLTLDTNGLRLEFAQPAGDIAVMPLYGTQLLPTAPAEFAAMGIPLEKAKRMPKVWEWSAAVTRDPLTRLRYWSSALTRYPIEAWGFYEDDTPEPGSARFHASFSWHPVTNGWDIPPLRMAPMSSALSEATRRHPEQHEFSSIPFDMEWPTLTGALRTVPETDRYSVVFRAAAAGQGTGSAAAPWWGSALGRGATAPAASDSAWVPWRFRGDSSAAPLERMPFRLREGSSVLEWVSTNSTGRISRSLGEIRAGEDQNQNLKVDRLNPDTVVWRWMK